MRIKFPHGPGIFLGISIIFLLLQNNGSSKIVLFFHLFSGYSYHRPADFNLSLDGYQYEINDVHFSSRSLEFPLYYGISGGSFVTLGQLRFRVGLEFLHDKIYARETRDVGIRRSTNPDYIPGNKYPFEKFLNQFSMSHGYNFLLIKLALTVFEARIAGKPLFVNAGIGVGPLVPHVESRKGTRILENYQWRGPAGMLELSGEWYVKQHLQFLAGFKLTAGRVKDADISGGTLSTRIWSGHFFLGIGFSSAVL